MKPDILLIKSCESSNQILNLVNSIKNNREVITKQVWVLIDESSFEQRLKSIEINYIRANANCVIRKIYAHPADLNNKKFVNRLVWAIKQDRRTIMIGMPIYKRMMILLRDWLQVYLMSV